MDFGRVELDERHAAFTEEVRRFFAVHVDRAAREHEERTGDGFNEAIHLAMGARGWIMDTWEPALGGAGLDRVEHRILTLERERTGLPFITYATTRLVAEAVRRHAVEAVREPLMRGAAEGTIRFCLGYTEPEGGSDVAAARTRAVRDADGWRVTGSKVFMTGAHNCQYAFTLTRTNPDVPKHRGLTMFLVPLDAPGVEISPIRTFGGERTNIVYFDDVPVDDHLRVGPVDGGWAILHDRLDVEHGLAADDPDHHLDPPSLRTPYAVQLATCVDAVHELSQAAGWSPDDHRRYRLGLAAVEAEAALSAPGHHGRVKAAEALIEQSARLLELVAEGAGADEDDPRGRVWRQVEAAHRFAQGTAIYGGTTEVFRNIIAEHDLGLPRPTYT